MKNHAQVGAVKGTTHRVTACELSTIVKITDKRIVSKAQVPCRPCTNDRSNLVTLVNWNFERKRAGKREHLPLTPLP